MQCGLLTWLSLKFSTFGKVNDQTPLPKWIILALFISMIGNAISLQVLFSFLPDMIKSFGISDEDAGYYVGLVASSVFVGRLITSYLWGWLSDKIGRRKVLLMCTIIIGVFMIAFGFSNSFEMAFVIRFVIGLFGGVVGTTKAVLAEISDNTNQALAMSLVVTAYNSGLIIGPAIGGYLSKPASKYSIFKGNDFFERFPYFFPCLVNAIILFVGFIMVYFKLPETLASKSKAIKKIDSSATPAELNISDDNESEQVSRKRVTSSSKGHSSTSSSSPQPHDEEVTFRKSSQDSLSFAGSKIALPNLPFRRQPGSLGVVDDELNQELSNLANAETPKETVARRHFNSFKKSKLAQLCRNRNVRYLISVYTVFCFAVVAEHEMYSLWAATGRELGGLDFDTNDLGFTLTCVGVACAIGNFIIFPRMVKFFGLIKTQFIMLGIAMFFTVVFPSTSILLNSGVVLKVVIITVMILNRVAQGCCFTGQFIMLNNCVTSDLRATAHGLAMMVSCAARAISPTFSGSMFSWSIKSGLNFPFNEKLVFIFLGFNFYLTIIILCCVEESAITKR